MASPSVPGVLNDHIDLALEKDDPCFARREWRRQNDLMNILYGLYQPDEGEIVNGERPKYIPR